MSWWTDKINQRQQGQAPPPAPPGFRPPVDPRYLPRGMGLDQTRAIQDYMARQGVPNTPQPPVQPPAAYQRPGDPNAQLNIVDAVKMWQGEDAAGKADTQYLGACPRCGSSNFLSRSNAEGGTAGTGGKITSDGRRVYPSPHCFDCGYGMGVGGSENIQQGALGVSAAKVVGAGVSRQGATPQPTPGLSTFTPIR